MINIINGVQKAVHCNIYNTMYSHDSQGKNKKRNKIEVVEYCIIFKRTGREKASENKSTN